MKLANQQRLLECKDQLLWIEEQANSDANVLTNLRALEQAMMDLVEILLDEPTQD